MPQDSSNLLETPSKRVYGEEQFQNAELCGVPLDHEDPVEQYQHNVLYDLEEVPRPRHDEAILVEQRSFAWVIEGYRLLLVSVGYQVEET